MEDPQYILSSSALGLIGGILGTLTGALSWSIRQIIKSKNSQIEAVTKDRDYWRNHVVAELERSGLDASQKQSPTAHDGGGPGARQGG